MLDQKLKLCLLLPHSKYPDIAGIGVTSFGETFVCVDEAGEMAMSRGDIS